MNNPLISLDFTTPPYEAIAALSAKKPTLLKDSPAQIKHDFYNKAFVVSGVADIEMLSTIQTSLVNALAKGQSFNTWKKEIKPILEKRGYGELNKSRLEKIYHTNIQNAYAQGRKKAQLNMSAPSHYTTIDKLSDTAIDKDIAKYDDGIYFRYVTMQDSRVRAEHARLHNVILPRKHPFWDKYYPPNGFGCRCSVMTLYANDLIKKGLKPTSHIPQDINDIDTIDFTPNNANDDLRNIIESKLKNYVNNENATNALHKILKEIEKRNKRFKRVNELYIQSALNQDKTKDTEKIVIARATDKLKAQLSTTESDIYLSGWTLRTHTHHDNVDSFDYSLIEDMLDKAYKSKSSRDRHEIFFMKLGYYYKAVFKRAVNDEGKDEIFLQSLVKSNKEIKY
ncbi:hypothetical protein LS73_003390 [Helicobacter muridarum]|uniref:Phage (Mu-like) virion morphogenesis protein n=1 Tax=Helicobacter muridarum TaxID=216 RepID=A0A099U0K0_9HELI|nr:phage minor head protein [Helicobacter muridarum]TLE00952.1 hypothetical protein LS73_003390 [Helicobacter muridarum]STQ86736.1 Phage (Mu-like) virion morphogenesis protein [Helicobacter muridarum]